jgi:hypothetical protein
MLLIWTTLSPDGSTGEKLVDLYMKGHSCTRTACHIDITLDRFDHLQSCLKTEKTMDGSLWYHVHRSNDTEQAAE